jgi:ligand-binding SRPBCC domain-containing protein
MTPESARMLAQNPWVLKRLAKHMALQCVRNTRLEELHAGTAPWSPAGDYSDVVVKTPAGEIPWPQVSRFNDEEMKALMVDVVNRAYLWLRFLFDDNAGAYLIQLLSQQDLVPAWNDPADV